VQLVLEELERPAQVALPAIAVADDEDVELARLRRVDISRIAGDRQAIRPETATSKASPGVDEAPPG
jgi:hypothetical protein